jgi:hypothetical protein
MRKTTNQKLTHTEKYLSKQIITNSQLRITNLKLKKIEGKYNTTKKL